MQAEHHSSPAPSKEEEILHAIGTLAADAGMSPPLVVKAFKADAKRTAHSRRALTNLHRFLLTGFSSAWIRDLNEHKLLRQLLLELFSQSQFLADILVRNPELFRWLTSTTVLKTTATSSQYSAEASGASALFQRMEKKLDSLKRFHRREFLRIGARQIFKEADVQTTSAELSSLADSIVETVLDLAYYQIAEGTSTPVPKGLAVIGLGKLGGGELNFSSDIDLMFVYDEDGPLSPPVGRSATLHEYYSRISEFVVRRLSEHTSEGHLYRVDMRLRPDGTSGPLAMSRAAYMAYYEARGELWERQMLIKARVIAGDRAVGERWRKDVRPFVYHRTHLTSPIDEIANIKTRIESALDSGTNIKLGSGGIRDIEFTVQALQLLNGGSDARLQTASTLQALESLAAAGHLEPTEGSELGGAYTFLRTVEDRLQLLHGLQEHSLPESPEEKRILARQLGYVSAASFEKDLHRHQRAIRSIFVSVFGVASSGKSISLGPTAIATQRELRSAGFTDPASAAQHLHALTTQIPALGMQNQLCVLLKAVRRWGAPDKCLEHLRLLAESVPIKRALAQAAGSESALDLILLICSRSSRYVLLLAREPLLFEALVGRSEDVLGAGRGWSFLMQSDLARYKQYNEFKSVIRLLSGEIDIRKCTRELSDLAEEVLRSVVEREIQSSPDLGRSPVAFLGLWKLGGQEISLGADLDLLMVYQEQGDGSGARAVNGLGRKIRMELERVYAIDFRLRPEGKNAPLATEFGYYSGYLTNRASLWERQALIRARFLAGDEAFGRRVLKTLRHYAFRSGLPPGGKKEIRTMRQRMAEERSKRTPLADLKVGVGGLVDLEFLVQSLQLRFGGEVEDTMCQNTFEAVEILAGSAKLRKPVAAKIVSHLEWMRRLELAIRLNSETQDFVLPGEPDRLQPIAATMGLSSSKRLLDVAMKIRKENRSLFLKTLASIPR